jgi:beta-glucanase (GH16 family)
MIIFASDKTQKKGIKMKKIILSVLVAATFIALVSCSNGTSGLNEATQPAKSSISSASSTPEQTTPPESNTVKGPKLNGISIKDYVVTVDASAPEILRSSAYDLADYLHKEYRNRNGWAYTADADPEKPKIIICNIAFNEGQYGAFVSEGNIYIGGGTNALTSDAVTYFIYHTDEFADDANKVLTSDVPLKNSYGYDLVWHDEFSFDTLDTYKWSMIQKMGWPLVMSSSEENINVKDGILNFAITGYNKIPFPISTEKKMAYRHGYIEISAKLTDIQGAWPAFWMQGAKEYNYSGTSYMPEIDVFELFDRNGDMLYTTLHKWYVSSWHGDPDFYYTAKREIGNYASPTLASEFHTYGFGWDDTQMYFTFDGAEVSRINYHEKDIGGAADGMSGFNNPIFVIFDLYRTEHDSTYWVASSADETYEDPMTFEIDWIRLYQDPSDPNSSIHFYDDINS